MQGIKVSVNYVGARFDIVLITILGYVDTTTCQELAKFIDNLIKHKQYQIIADLGGVTYISSAGWGVFVSEIKNIKDKGGDLKIVQMSQEVFEVFEMLEFNRILNYYDSIEEAMDEFDIIRGIDISQTELGLRPPEKKVPSGFSNVQTETTFKYTQRKAEKYSSNPTIPVKDFPLMEKIKLIVVENPFWGIRGICEQLKNEKYGLVHVGWFRMYSILKKLNLETKEKRYRFYRSR